jgi:F420-dependent oxidoreductase-like protein
LPDGSRSLLLWHDGSRIILVPGADGAEAGARSIGGEREGSDAMEIGVGLGALGGGLGEDGLDAVVREAQALERRGFGFTALANIRGFDAISALAIVGRETERIQLQTAVTPTYPRHPVAMAQQALTTQAAAGGRFTLGIGLSHQPMIEGALGLSYAKPARHMREYLSVLMPLLRGEPVSFHGEQYNVEIALQVPEAEPVPCIVAALGSVMLRVAGELADGTVTWMCGLKTLETHIAPRIRRAAAAAGRPEPRVIAGLPIAITDDADKARQVAARNLANYPRLASYRAMLDIEGAENPGEIAIVGGEEEVDGQLRRLEEAGVTHFQAAPFEADDGATERTIEYLASRL